ncbi:MAG TPA: type-F conjugative transfer system pilin assembly protein TrbC [Rubrivivax sp.]|nr:type-F conjugative transfer system pilin assembly protein TrbC [Rubrivivax sp.]
MTLPSAAFGQVPPPVTAAEIERARQSHRMPTDAELARVPVPAAPRIDALPQPVTKSPIDLEALAKGFDNDAAQPEFAAKAGPTLLVFVSFAMPEATIGRLLDQAERAGATLVLRGLVNGSMRDTVERMQRLIGERRVAVQIDPQAFDRFSIVRTPAFVLVRSGALAQPCSSGTCLAGDQFVMAAGDVSLDYALSFFERSAPSMSRDASSLLLRMKGASR